MVDAGRLRVKGLRLSVGLATIAGLDSRPGELLGWGMLHADLARRMCAAPRASWWYVLTEPDGRPMDVGPIRARPPWPVSTTPAGRYPGVEVWLQLTREEFGRLTHAPPPGWAKIIADLAHQLTCSAGGPPKGDPRDRLPGAPLRRWLHVRDRRCVFPGCRVAPHRCDADHSIEYAQGGPTIAANLADACSVDHALRHKGGWTVAQPTPGRVVWTSRLGHRYERITPSGPAHAFDPMPVPSSPYDDWGTPRPDDDRDWSAESCLWWWPAAPTQPNPAPETDTETNTDTETRSGTVTDAAPEPPPRFPQDDPPPF